MSGGGPHKLDKPSFHNSDLSCVQLLVRIVFSSSKTICISYYNNVMLCLILIRSLRLTNVSLWLYENTVQTLYGSGVIADETENPFDSPTFCKCLILKH